MPRCSNCGLEHEVLDPTFRRPEPYVQLDPQHRETHAKANDDLCRITLPDRPARYFLRGVLPVEVRDRSQDLWWRLWAEVSESTFRRVLELWSTPNQASEPPFDGTLANAIPGYPNCLGLPLSVQLTGPSSRPEFRFRAEAQHPFAAECAAGVDSHRAAEWGALIEVAP